MQIKVDFRSEERGSKHKKKLEDHRGGLVTLQKLSGGQKTVVAICILMSLQVVNPAPFYVFDEMDAALDPLYRQNIKDVIASNAKHA